MNIDYSFYRDEYLGHLPQNLFLRFAPRAQAFLQFACAERLQGKEDLLQVKMALCAVTEQLEKLSRQGGVKAESAGEYAVQYEKENSDLLYRAAQLYLPDTMLYRGWRACW